jgi:SAM-dependent methyltransferase
MHSLRTRQHEYIEAGVAAEIGRLIRTLGPCRTRLLHLHARQGLHTVFFRAQLAKPQRPVIYDDEDKRDAPVKAVTDFVRIDVEEAAFPAPNGHFDLVVWNRELVTVRRLGPALGEMRRVLQPGGMAILAVPNLAALHNRLLLLAGRQPTTLHIGSGDHIRGFTIPSMTRYLHRDLNFQVLRISGVGLAPVTAAALPGPLRGLSHSVVWALQKPAADPLADVRLPGRGGKASR